MVRPDIDMQAWVTGNGIGKPPTVAEAIEYLDRVAPATARFVVKVQKPIAGTGPMEYLIYNETREHEFTITFGVNPAIDDAMANDLKRFFICATHPAPPSHGGGLWADINTHFPVEDPGW